MAKKRWTRRLGAELAVAVVLSLCLGVSVFFCLRWGIYQAAGRYIQSKDFLERQDQKAADRLQEYITKSGSTSSDWEQLNQWAKKEQYLDIYIYDENKVIYSTYGLEEIVMEDGTENVLMSSVYPVVFGDEEAKVWIISYYSYKYYRWLDALAGFISFWVFMIFFLWMIRKKTAYVERLKEELQILQGGNLAYQVTVKGKDELAELAQGINDMRCAIMEREEDERRARRANHELVTAMSHDLRSPLTSLMGYLDFIDSGIYEDEEQWKHFVRNSRKKAYQIKEMSDRLFEYFLVYEGDEEEVEKETLDAAALLEQTIWEGAFDLESRGFEVIPEMGDITCEIKAHAELFRRLSDNLFSNVIKYASREAEVKIRCHEEREYLLISISNGKDCSKRLVESSGIGLKTCRKIVEEHGGRFLVTDNAAEFKIEIFWKK